MLRIVALDSATAVTSPCSSPDMSVTSAASMATSVPVPIAMPTSACASAGLSLMPSPTIATTLPSSCRARTSAAFWSGRTSARTRVMPTCRATAFAVRGLSPVIITTSSPRSCRARIATAESGRTVSATATSPAGRPSMATYIGVLPSSASRSAWASSSPVAMSASRSSRALPMSSSRASTVARTPLPVTESKVVTAGRSRPLSRAPATMAPASGCSLSTSAAATRRSSSSWSCPPTVTTSVREGLPRVMVPVLSSTMVCSLWAVSSASALLTSTPDCAPFPVATMIDSGVASPSAHGHAMINTLTVATTASGSSGPRTNHRTNVATARNSTAGTK